MDAVQNSALMQSGAGPAVRVQVPVAASGGASPAVELPPAPVRVQTPLANAALADAGRKAVEQAVAQIQKFVQSTPSSELEFSVDNASGRVIVRVTDAQTKQVIRQLPSEEVLAISRALDRFQGLLLAQKA